MSVQQLSAAVERFGVTIERPVLSNLENGRRSTVSVAEWLVLSAALGVPPLLMLFPVGRVPAIEPLPDREMTPWTALRWALTGQPQVSGTTEVSTEDAGLIEHFRVQQDLIEEWARMGAAVRGARDRGGNPAGIEDLERRQVQAVDALCTVRQLVRQSGLTPLGLPAGLSYLDEDAAT